MGQIKLFMVVAAALLAGASLAATSASASQNDCLSYGYACTPGYDGANAAGTWAWSHYGGSYAVNANGYHNCTLYAAWRLEQNGMADPGNWGDAVEWIGHTSSNHTPAVGSIAWWGGGYGHVAYVEQVRGGEVFIRADNYIGPSSNGYTNAGWIAASSVGVFLHPHDLSGDTHSPVGSIDVAGSPLAGEVRVAGWAFDPDAKTSPVTIHAYVGGQAGQPGAEGHDLGPASGYRPDVGSTYAGVGNYHGYDHTFATARVGSVPVCVYAINIGAGSNHLLGCKTVKVEDPNPTGSLDAAGSPLAGEVRIGGWAFDPDAKTSPVTIHAYVGGQAGQPGAEGHDLGPASGYRPDVGRTYSGVGNYHGYDHTFATAKVGSVPVCVYAINIGAGSNRLLACRTVDVEDPTPLGSLDGASSPQAGEIKVAGWAFDPDAKTSPVTIHAYVGGEAGQPGVEGHNLGQASEERPDVGRVYPSAGAEHGFDWSFETAKVGSFPVCVYAINIGAGSNHLLGCKTVSVAPKPPPSSSSPSSQPLTSVDPARPASHHKTSKRHRRHRHRHRAKRRNRLPVLGSRSFAPHGKGFGMVEPKVIYNGGDPSGLVIRIHWRRWGRRVALGSGLTSIIKPHGGYYRRRGRIRLRVTHLGRCTGTKRRAYRRLEVRIARHPGGRLGPWIPWGGPGRIC